VGKCSFAIALSHSEADPRTLRKVTQMKHSQTRIGRSRQFSDVLSLIVAGITRESA
jgi:hypothetical protein